MNKISFKIQGLDCPEEVKILKRELLPLLDSEKQLSFNLLYGKMTVTLNDNPPAESEIIKTISKTGMRAIPWETYTQQHRSWWNKHARTIMIIVSILSLILGFSVHAIKHNFLDAFINNESLAGGLPMFSIVFYSLSIITGGFFIFPKAIFAARKLRPDMNLLMVIAVIGAVAINQWFEAATVTILFSLALLLESWSIGRARRAIGSLIDLSPTIAHVLTQNGNTNDKLVEEVDINSILIIKPGEKIPLDGLLIAGSTSVNQAPITGESMPIEKEEGDQLFAGTINGDGVIQLKVTKIAKDSTLMRIIRLVEEAQSRRAKSEQWVETFARYYTPIMIIVALFLATIPPLLFGGNWSRWIYESLVILVIACPCALVISTPVSIVAALNSAARAGILIKGGIYLELPAKLKAIAFDKTGTLTSGKPTVQNIYPYSGHTENEVLERAAALEAYSEHPLARAIQQKAIENKVTFKPAERLNVLKGKGAEGKINDRLFWIGSHRFLHEKAGALESVELHQEANDLENSGHTVVTLGHDQHICGIIGIADTLRPSCRESIALLKKLGIKKTIMLTGDNTGTARAIAKESGIDEFKAELLPEDKVKYIEALVKENGDVAMIGDGVNDAPAMAASTLSIAMGTAGTDAAIETADIALMSDDLRKIPWLIQHSRRTLWIIKQNITFALAIKAIFITLAFMGLATLWMAIAADMGASLLVIFNGLRLLAKTED